MATIQSLLATALGLRPSDAKVLLACIQSKGGLSIKDATACTRLKRSTVVVILERLAKTGLVTYHYEGARRMFKGLNPEQLLFHIQQKEIDFKSLIPYLMKNMGEDLSAQVRFYQGKDGLNMIFNDMLLACRLLPESNREILTLTSGATLMRALPDHLPSFIRKRVKSRIALRWIGPDDKNLASLKFQATVNLRRMKFFDGKAYPFSIEIDVYANRVALIAFSKPDFAGFVIQQDEIAKSFRSIFELLWDFLDAY
jgi:predicted transcriptional regulator